MEQLTLGDTGPTLTTIDVLESDLILDKRIQPRVGMDQPTVAAYAALYREGHDLGPLVVFDNGETAYLADGFHRMLAAVAAGLPSLPAEVHRGTFRDALLYATGCNKHGKQLTNADKRKAVTTLLQDEEWSRWSNNAIAKHCGVSHTFVNALRSALETVSSAQGDRETSQPTTRKYVNKHGQQVTMQVGAIGHRSGQTICTDCGRPLTDAESISRGFGPICACKQQPTLDAAVSFAPRLEATEWSTREEIPSETTFPLEAPLDIHDPKGTAPWARAMRAELASLWRDASCNLHRFRNYLRVFAEHNGAQYFADACGAPFPSLWAFCTAKSPQGIGYEQELLDTFLIDIHQIALPPPAPVEAPAAPTTGRPPGYGALPAKIREAMQAHRKKGITAGALATKLDAPRKQVWATLERFVTQGKAQKNGTAYHWVAEARETQAC